jgi:circadian clock protein KaiC
MRISAVLNNYCKTFGGMVFGKLSEKNRIIMRKKVQILPSGIPLVDKIWRGFYRGGSYLLIGQHKTGKTLLGLQYARECVKQKEVCLYFTSIRPKELLIHAASVDFDIQHYMDQNQIILIRVTPPEELYDGSDADSFLMEYMKDLELVVEQAEPDKIVFDEMTPFIGFQDSELLKDVYAHTTEIIEEAGITSLYVLRDPATVAAKQLVDSIVSLSTGVVYLEKKTDEKKGEMIITPNIGHYEGQVKSEYIIEPHKGVVLELIDEEIKKKISTGGNGKRLEGNTPKFLSLKRRGLKTEPKASANYKYSLNIL